MKPLKTVQLIARILRILSVIALVCTIIGTVGVLIGGGVLLAFPDMDAEILQTILSEADAVESAEDLTNLGIALLAGGISLVGQIITTALFAAYLKHELADGTPFTVRGAKELRRVGVLTLVIPFVTACASATVTSLLGVEPVISTESSMWLGVVLFLVSFLLRYGAELEKKTAKGEKKR